QPALALEDNPPAPFCRRLDYRLFLRAAPRRHPANTSPDIPTGRATDRPTNAGRRRCLLAAGSLSQPGQENGLATPPAARPRRNPRASLLAPRRKFHGSPPAHSQRAAPARSWLSSGKAADVLLPRAAARIAL